MVDPHRKINILTEDQQNFIEDCEEEFRGRFTEADEEYMAYCQKPRPPPPILDPWLAKTKFNDHHRSGNNEGYNRGRNFNYHNRGRNDYRYNRGGGRGHDGGNSGYHGSQTNNRKRSYNDR